MQIIVVFILFSFFVIVPSVIIFFADKIWRRKPFIKRYFWLPPILIELGLLILTFIVSRKYTNSHEAQLGWAIMGYFMVVTPRLIYALLLIITSPLRLLKIRLKKYVLNTAIVLAIAAELIMIYGMAYGRNKIQVNEFTYYSKKLPKSFDGYRIVQLSDLHMGGWMGNKDALKRLIDRANELKPDLIVFTGDLVNHRAIELIGFEDILSRLTAPDGVYSILGNHDYGPYYRFWKNKAEMAENLQTLMDKQAQMGWVLLNNDHRFIHNSANDSIALIGVENDGEPPFSQYADLKKAMTGVDDQFKILLTHNPSHWRREVLPTTDIDLSLAGHTHAMQIELFGYSPSVFKYKEWGGPYYEGERCIYVNIGAGEVGIPFRFGAWPEITVITLRHKE